MLLEDFLGIIVYLHLPFAFHTATLKAKIDTADPGKQTAKRKATHFRFSRFRAAFAVFGRFLVFVAEIALNARSSPQKSTGLESCPFLPLLDPTPTKLPSGWLMFLRCVIGLPRSFPFWNYCRCCFLQSLIPFRVYDDQLYIWKILRHSLDLGFRPVVHPSFYFVI